MNRNDDLVRMLKRMNKEGDLRDKGEYYEMVDTRDLVEMTVGDLLDKYGEFITSDGECFANPAEQFAFELALVVKHTNNRIPKTRKGWKKAIYAATAPYVEITFPPLNT